MAEKWYNLSPEQVCEKLSTDPERGLSPRQAAARIRREGNNTVYRAATVSPRALVKEVLRDPCAYMLLASAVLARIFNEDVGAFAIIFLVLINAFVVTLAYLKSRAVISQANAHTLPTVTVIRGGKQYLVKQDRIVRGDIILVGKGDIVPADARIIESEELRCIETSLTGEVGKKKKDKKTVYANNLAPGGQSDMIFATSIVAQGHAKAVVCETGDSTLAVYLGKGVEIGGETRLGVFDSLKKHCSAWSFVMLILVFILTLTDFVVGFESRSIFNIFITGLSLATAGMCEYYLVFGYIITGCGLYGMLRRRKDVGSGAVIKNISDIEKLSGITTLIVPKEGAFVTGNVALKKLYCDSTLFGRRERNLHRSCYELISAALDSTSYIERDYEKCFNSFKARDVSPEEKAIFKLACESGVFDGPAYMGDHILKEVGREGDIARVRVSVNGRDRVILRGRYEEIIPLCESHRANDKIRNIKNEKNRIKNTLRQLKSEGLYGVCLASKESSDITDDSGFVFEGFLALNEPVLTGAAENVKRILDAGIKVIMLSDDSSATGRNFARSLGVISSDGEIMSSLRLSTMTDDLFRTNASVYRLYEGLDQGQKRLLVSHLRENGEVVGYFGQNFEDIMLIKEADVGFSTGVTLLRGNSVVDLSGEDSPVFIRSQREKGSGSEALKQVCRVVVSPTDGKSGGFNAIAGSIASSRLVLRSLSRAVRYLITSQCARMFIFLYSVLVSRSGLPFCGEAIFTPVQLLTLGLIFDLLAVMAFAFKSSRGRIAEREIKRKTNPFTDNLGPMLFGVAWGVAALTFPVILRLVGVGVSNEQMSTMVFYGFILTQAVATVSLMSQHSVFRGDFRSNLRLMGIFLILLAFIGLCGFTPFGKIFGAMPLTPIQWGFTLLQPLAVLGIYEIHKLMKKEKKEEDILDNDTEN